MATKVTTLKNAEKTDDLVPRTQLKGIFDKNGNYIDDDLLASDLNKLKGGVVDELVICTEDEVGVPIPVNADQLEGHPASYFATADSVIFGTFTLAVSTGASGGVYKDNSDRDIPITDKTIKGICVYITSDHLAWVGRVSTVGGKITRLYIYSTIALSTTLSFSYVAFV